MSAADFDTPSKRLKLPPRRNPYWLGVSGGRGGISLGYRKPSTGPGAWIGKVVVEGRRIEEKIGVADDNGCPAGASTYRAAVSTVLEWGKRQNEILAAADGGSRYKDPTVRSAIESYAKGRVRKSEKDGADAERRLNRHCLSDAKFADLPLKKLRASSIEAWRDRLPIVGTGAADGHDRPITASTVNRLLNDLRAALNAAAEKHRRELPPHLAGEIKVGTRALPSSANARKQFLTADEVRALIDAAFAVDDEGDLGRLVLVLAATGARYSQVAEIRVGDVQGGNGRIMVPRSRKGKKTGPTGRIAVPVSSETLGRLRPAFEDRPADRVLLEHWGWRQTAPLKWERDGRRAWGDSEMVRPWGKVKLAAGVAPDVVPYAFRHTSILRGLQAGLPVRLVASLHDTSVQMIEAHYSAYIVDASEELARRAML